MVTLVIFKILKFLKLRFLKLLVVKNLEKPDPVSAKRPHIPLLCRPLSENSRIPLPLLPPPPFPHLAHTAQP